MSGVVVVALTAALFMLGATLDRLLTLAVIGVFLVFAFEPTAIGAAVSWPSFRPRPMFAGALGAIALVVAAQLLSLPFIDESIDEPIFAGSTVTQFAVFAFMWAAFTTLFVTIVWSVVGMKRGE